MDFLINGFLSLVDTYILFLFSRLLMQSRKNSKIIVKLSFISIMVLHLFASIFINNNSPYKFIATILIDFLFCSIFFVDKWYKYLLSIGLYYILILIVESAMLSILNTILPNFNANGVTDELYTLPTMTAIIIVRLVELFIVFILRVLKNKPIRHNQWQGLLLMPILTVIFVWLIFPYYWALHNKEIENLLIALAIFLIVQNLFIFIYITLIQTSTEQYLLMKEAYDRQKQYSSTISAIQKAVRKMAHDIRHHFIYLRSALDQEDIPKAKAYLNQLDENLENIIPLNVTGHYDVDALLHAKASIAEKLGINIHVEGILPPELMISPIDLSALLGNSLDNAIESASRIDGRKEITIAFYYNASRLNYTISNPYNGQLQKKPDGYFVSQKGSGLGFEIMDEVVKKYSGALLTENDDNNFKLTVMLQTPQS